MKSVCVLGIVFAAAPAVAQPVTRPDTCGATIAYAPADVRDTVDGYVRAEAYCNVSLEVRIVPTEGGLYLFARDERGQVRERIVPDAQAAAVLVASWLADDSKPPPPDPVFFAPRVPPADFTLDPLVDEEPAPEAKRKTKRAPRWLALGPVLRSGVRGMRAELDLRTAGKWTFGLAASLSNGRYWMPYDYSPIDSRIRSTGELDLVDTKAVGYIARQSRLGNWRFRPHVGAGVVYTRLHQGMVDMTQPAYPRAFSITNEAVALTAEVALTIGRRLGRNWQLDGGPLITWFNRAPLELERRADGMIFIALRHRR